MESTCYSYFAIHGDDFDPADITAALQIQPNKQLVNKAGDPHRFIPNKTYPFSRWCSQKFDAIGDEESEFSLGRQLNQVVDLFESKIALLNTLKVQYNLTFVLQMVPSFYVTPEKSQPVLVFSHKVMKFCYLTNSEIDVDWYFNSDKPQQLGLSIN